MITKLQYNEITWNILHHASAINITSKALGIKK